MDAGPELDALVAEKVMGWASPVAKSCEASRPHYKEYRDGSDCCPPFSTMIWAAWEVAEKLKMGVCPHRFGGWLANLKPWTFPEDESSARADTAPLAICLAALKSIS